MEYSVVVVVGAGTSTRKRLGNRPIPRPRRRERHLSEVSFLDYLHWVLCSAAGSPSSTAKLNAKAHRLGMRKPPAASIDSESMAISESVKAIEPRPVSAVGSSNHADQPEHEKDQKDASQRYRKVHTSLLRPCLLSLGLV